MKYSRKKDGRRRRRIDSSCIMYCGEVYTDKARRELKALSAGRPQFRFVFYFIFGSFLFSLLLLELVRLPNSSTLDIQSRQPCNDINLLQEDEKKRDDDDEKGEEREE